MKIILDRLKTTLGYSQDNDLANHLGVNQNVISNWKKRGSIDLDLIFSKCQDVSPTYIVTGEGPERMSQIVNYTVGPIADRSQLLAVGEKGLLTKGGTAEYSRDTVLEEQVRILHHLVDEKEKVIRLLEEKIETLQSKS